MPVLEEASHRALYSVTHSSARKWMCPRKSSSLKHRGGFLGHVLHLVLLEAASWGTSSMENMGSAGYVHTARVSAVLLSS